MKKKKTFGQVVNELKQKAEAKVQEWRDRLEERNENNGIYGDLSRPAAPAPIGARHPISLVKNEIVKIFANIGFDVSDGPEMEDDWHNFTALNLPEYHPARDMQDTFFIQTNPDILLRTHTSSVQIPLYGKPPAAYPYNLPRACVPQRGYFGSLSLFVPPSRRFVYR